MKISKVIVIVVSLLLAVVGWISTIGGMFSGVGQAEKLIAAGDAYFERGLYQRAAKEYEASLEYKVSEGVWDKIVDAYRARYEEGGDQSEYITAMANAFAAYPGKHEYVETIIELYSADGMIQDAYAWVVKGERQGVDSEKFIQLKRNLRYLYDFGGQQYETFGQETNGWYSLVQEGKWGYVPQDLSTTYDFVFEYIGPFNADNTRVETMDGESRLIGTGNFVLGIFEKVVEEAGILSEELIPAKTGKEWDYYNSLAEKQFGGFEYAGAFQNGTAAVKKDGKWGIIDKTGEFVSDTRYDEIVLDAQGFYLSSSGVMVASEDGKYNLYDKSFKQITDADWTAAGACNGEWIAVCEDGKWGFANSEGEMAIEPAYEDARSFRNGLAAVCKDGKWGFVDTDNYLAIDYQFVGAGDFNSAGCCLVAEEAPAVEPIPGTEPSVEPEPADPIWTFIELRLGIIA